MIYNKESKKTITVTSPLLPPLEEFEKLLEDIWQRKWITNNGHYHQELENALSKYLGVPYISLFTNGTLPLITALQDMHITGEVITTPYSFVATTHAIWWNGLKPVFVDVDPVYGNLDPEKIEAAITPNTTAIMPVHVYGNPCQIKKNSGNSRCIWAKSYLRCGSCIRSANKWQVCFVRRRYVHIEFSCYKSI